MLIVGDSMLCRTYERKITQKNNVEVKFSPGVIIQNMEEYPNLLQKINLFHYLHIGTDSMLNELSRKACNIIS